LVRLGRSEVAPGRRCRGDSRGGPDSHSGRWPATGWAGAGRTPRPRCRSLVNSAPRCGGHAGGGVSIGALSGKSRSRPTGQHVQLARSRPVAPVMATCSTAPHSIALTMKPVSATRGCRLVEITGGGAVRVGAESGHGTSQPVEVEEACRAPGRQIARGACPNPDRSPFPATAGKSRACNRHAAWTDSQPAHRKHVGRSVADSLPRCRRQPPS
jgi:hypothetical protein